MISLLFNPFAVINQKCYMQICDIYNYLLTVVFIIFYNVHKFIYVRIKDHGFYIILTCYKNGMKFFFKKSIENTFRTLLLP